LHKAAVQGIKIDKCPQQRKKGMEPTQQQLCPRLLHRFTTFSSHGLFPDLYKSSRSHGGRLKHLRFTWCSYLKKFKVFVNVSYMVWHKIPTV